MKKNICIDFDGCIHTYHNGWQGGVIYGEIVHGFFEWALSMQDEYTLNVFSSRSSDPKLKKDMEDWIYKKYGEYFDDNNLKLSFPVNKPPSIIYIDDRGFRFQGTWSDQFLKPYPIENIKTWTSDINIKLEEMFEYFTSRFITPTIDPFQDYIIWCETDASSKKIRALKYYISGFLTGNIGSAISYISKNLFIQETTSILYERIEKFDGDDFEVKDFINFFRGQSLSKDNIDRMYKNYLRIKLEN